MKNVKYYQEKDYYFFLITSLKFYWRKLKFFHILNNLTSINYNKFLQKQIIIFCNEKNNRDLKVM